MTTALLHSYSANVPERPGLFPLGDGTNLPAEWQPDPRQYQPAALPTPFARAEATTLVLEQSAPGEHPLFDQFGWMLLGVVSGVLRLAPDDLRDDRYDNFGKALLQVDDGARYFSRVVWPDGASGGLLFGASYRTCLLWPHARRVASQWNALAQAIQGRQSEALVLLAQWREALRRQGRWSAQLVAWQRGVDATLGNNVATDVDVLRTGAALHGPVWAVVPTGDPARPTRAEPLYLPVLDPGRFERFRDLLQSTPRRAPDGSAVELADAAGAACARIETPRVAADASTLALGAGNLSFGQQRGALGEGAPRLAELEELLEPVRLALQKEGRATDAASVRAGIGFYPDALRLLDQVKEAAAPADLILTSRLQVLALRGIRVPTEDSDDIASIDAGGKRVTLVDRVGESALFELRALGFLLFRVFSGELAVRDGAIVSGGNPASFAGGAMIAADAKHPLEPSSALYQAVAAAPPSALARRLALLQRFVATYRSAEPMLDKAARSFATWAWGTGTAVAGLGKRGDRALPWRVAGLELRLARDPLLGP